MHESGLKTFIKNMKATSSWRYISALSCLFKKRERRYKLGSTKLMWLL